MEGHWPKQLSLTEPQQMPDQRRGTLSRLLYTHDFFTRRIFLFQTAQKKCTVAAHDREHVPEFVRDAAGKPADRLHFLSAPQLFFQAAALGNIARGALNCHWFCVLVNQPA